MKINLGKTLIEAILRDNGTLYCVGINGLVIVINNEPFFTIGFPIFWTE